jgi:hypothetical protein
MDQPPFSFPSADVLLDPPSTLSDDDDDDDDDDDALEAAPAAPFTIAAGIDGNDLVAWSATPRATCPATEEKLETADKTLLVPADVTTVEARP